MSAKWNHNIHYYDLVLRCIPRPMRRALDVGCGEGTLAQKMADHCEEVIGIDNDSSAVLGAVSSAQPTSRIRFVHGDVMTHPFAPESFGFIAAVASLHHLCLVPALRRLRDLLQPGGVLVVVGLYRPETLVDWTAFAIGTVTSWWYRRFRHLEEVRAPICHPRESLSEIRAASESLMRGAEVRRRLLFRYSLVWKKEAPALGANVTGLIKSNE